MALYFGVGGGFGSGGGVSGYGYRIAPGGPVIPIAPNRNRNNELKESVEQTDNKPIVHDNSKDGGDIILLIIMLFVCLFITHRILNRN